MNAPAPTGTAPLDTDLTTGAEAGRSERRRIDAAAPLHEKADAVVDAVRAANDAREPEVMARGTRLVRMSQRGALEPYSTHSLRDRISRVACFHDGNGSERPDPPGGIAENVLSRDVGAMGMPEVRTVVDVPVVGPDERVVDRPGHHEAGGIYLLPRRCDARVPAPGTITTWEARDALALLRDDLLGDFGFADEGSRTNALAMLLTPFLRPLIPGPTPLFVVHAPGPGWGKGTLIDAALIPGCGSVPKTAGARDEAEWRKTITAALIAAPPAIVLDNLVGRIDSPSLAQAIVEPIWSDRVLGESRSFEGEVRNIWVADGNNVTLSPEIADRAVPIRLGSPANASDEVLPPRQRPASSWQHPNLREWAMANRAALATAALVVAQNWLDGRVTHRLGPSEMREPDERAFPDRTMGSFEGWSWVVGGALSAAGVDGFLDGREGAASEMVDSEDGRVEFLEAWHSLDRGPITARELSSLCVPGGALADHLPIDLPRADQTAVSYWLRAAKDDWCGGFRVVKASGSSKNAGRWDVARRATA